MSIVLVLVLESGVRTELRRGLAQRVLWEAELRDSFNQHALHHTISRYQSFEDEDENDLTAP